MYYVEKQSWKMEDMLGNSSSDSRDREMHDKEQFEYSPPCWEEDNNTIDDIDYYYQCG